MTSPVGQCEECGMSLDSKLPGTRKCLHCLAGCGRCMQLAFVICPTCLLRLHPERANDRKIDFDRALEAARREAGGEEYVDVDRTISYRAPTGWHYLIFSTSEGPLVIGPDYEEVPYNTILP